MQLSNEDVKKYERLIHWVINRMPLHALEKEDAISIGWLAAVKAAKNYDSSKGGFASYLCTRVRGDILDELRRIGNVTRRGVKRPDLISFEWLVEQNGGLFDLEDGQPIEPDLGYEQDFGDITKDLTKAEQTVLYLRYSQEDLTMRDISEFLDISESRVCQLHSRAINKIRANKMPAVA